MDGLKSGGGFRIGAEPLQALRAGFDSARVSEAETAAAIRDFHRRGGTVLCPHTAIGAHVAARHTGTAPMITLATAHPAKFPAAVRDACGEAPALPPAMADLCDRPERVRRVANDLDALKSVIREHLAR